MCSHNLISDIPLEKVSSQGYGLKFLRLLFLFTTLHLHVFFPLWTELKDMSPQLDETSLHLSLHLCLLALLLSLLPPPTLFLTFSLCPHKQTHTQTNSIS